MNTYKKLCKMCQEVALGIAFGFFVGVIACAFQPGSSRFEAHFLQQRVAGPRPVQTPPQERIHTTFAPFPLPFTEEEPPGHPYLIQEAEQSSQPPTASKPALHPIAVQAPPVHERKMPTRQHASAPEMNTAPVASRAVPLLQADKHPSAPVKSVREQTVAIEHFPSFDRTLHPVAEVPNWGAMRTPAQWGRTYEEMTEQDFVPIPRYNRAELTIPTSALTSERTPENTRILTAKLYYSTRFLGSYDIDADEGTGRHAGLDLKLPLHTPVGVLAGGRVQTVATDERLGLHVIIEHRHPRDGTFFTVYGHLDSALVRAGQDVVPGQPIGKVGMTGKTSGPHLHLQVDLPAPNEGATHTVYDPPTPPSAQEAARYSMNPILFLQRYARTTALGD